MNPPRLPYRAEIDGLRAIAVVSVILYHAQMVLLGKDWFEGGFIGVDIFFVISGYLITRIILLELQYKGKFNFLEFYEKRARRIMPMLFLIIFASAPFAWNMLLPSDFIEYTQSVIASLFFSSNFFFYFNTTEYGADSALLKPFLHTWSLGVEEQFYLIFPVIAILAYKLFRNHFLTLIFGLSLISLQFSEFMDVKNSDLNFYLPFSRFWELAVGSMLAYRELNEKNSFEGIARKIFPMLGLYFILYSIFTFDKNTPHPSFHTLIPVIGVALIIGFASKDELVGRALGSKPFVWVGLISYSAYLWHFPIFAFSRMGGVPTNYDKIGWIVLTFVLSIVSYFLVEQTFRNRSLLNSKHFLITMITSLFLVCGGAYLVISNNGFDGRFTKVVGLENFELDNENLRDKSWELISERNKNNPNFLDVNNKILLIGNSHAKDFYNALVESGYVDSETDVLRGNLPQIRCANETIDDYARFREGLYNSRKWLEASTILISTRYQQGKCSGKDKEQSSSTDIEGLPYLIQRAKSDGKRVIVLGNTVEFSEIENQLIADYVYNVHKDDAGINIRADEIFDEAARLLWENRTGATDKNQQIAEIANKLGVSYFDKKQIVCDDRNKTCSAFTNDGYKTLYDYGHWTLEGAAFFGARLSEHGFDELLK